MRRLACILGWLLLLGALLAAAGDFLGADPQAGFRLRPAGQVWYRLDAGSLNLTQAVIERYLWPPLWDPAFVGLLQLPAVVVLAVPGLALALLCHLRRLRRRRRLSFK